SVGLASASRCPARKVLRTPGRDDASGPVRELVLGAGNQLAELEHQASAKVVVGGSGPEERPVLRARVHLQQGEAHDERELQLGDRDSTIVAPSPSSSCSAVWTAVRTSAVTAGLKK